MRPLYLIANWKMNPSTKKEALALLKSTEKTIVPKVNVHVALCPPFLYIPLIAGSGRTKTSPELVRLGRKVELGAQNCFWQKNGPFTGEVSPDMLADFGCKYVIVGHSERREMGEDSALINKKILAALDAGLQPIFAVGEQTRDEGAGEHMRAQIIGGLQDVPRGKIKNIIMVYEPVWAISKGDSLHVSATPQDIFGSILFIRKTIAKLYSRSIAEAISVLYGGTANSKNLLDILQEGHADGALVGGASLNSEEWAKMIKIISSPDF